MIGHKLSHYRIVSELGHGGMGVAYCARDETLGRDVALKILPADSLADEQARRRLIEEARLASALNHPHICTIYEAGESQGHVFIAMELVEGKPLREAVAPGGFPAEIVLRYGAQIADALDHAHARGIVHRDLKSVNVMVTPEGRAKVLDFGLAQRLPPDELAEATRSQVSVAERSAAAGTLAYMPPEQLRGEPADARSDIWALGVTLSELAEGRVPFRGQSGADLSSAILRDPPPSLPAHVLPGLAGVIRKCLAKDPVQRYQRASEVCSALEALSQGSMVAAVAAAAQPVRTPLRRRLLAPAALLALLAVLFALNVGGVRQRFFSGSGAPKIESIAVLPLENLSGDPAQEYFADGMTEALITELSKISALKVISRTSAMQYKGAMKPMPQVARELGVDALIEGSVLREGDQVRITVQLIHGPTDHHLWAQNYQRELRGILALHSEVARAIAGEIEIKLTPQEQTRLASARPVDPRAYELYVLGRHYWSQRTIDGYKRAVESFQKALDLDSGHATTYAALADTYMLLGEQGGLPQKEARALAEAAVRQALELDETLAEAHASLGQWKLHYEWNWAEAERAFQRAIELNPGHAASHQQYGRFLGFVGRFDDALREVQRAREFDPLSITINAYIGQVYIYARQYDRAAEQLQKTLELNPNHVLVRHNLGELYLAQGRFTEAVTELEKAVELSLEPSAHYVAILGCAYARANRRQDAVKILNELNRRSKQGLVSAFDMASLHTALGEKERALAWLEQGYAERDAWLVELKAWPWFESLLPEPRFQALLQCMNFPR